MIIFTRIYIIYLHVGLKNNHDYINTEPLYLHKHKSTLTGRIYTAEQTMSLSFL